MANAIDKAFMILEKIASSASAPLAPAQLADELKINRATCSRIIKQLMENGYVTRVSRRQGYAAGPKLHTLSTICRYEHELLKQAIPLIDRCAAELRGSVLLCKLNAGKRYILYHRNCCPDLHITIDRPCYDDVFATATGVLLAACSSKNERESCFKIQKACGGAFFAGLDDPAELHKKLDAVKQNKSFCLSNNYQSLYAFPVKNGNKIVAVLGMSTLKNQNTPALHQKICKTLQNTAEEISQSLNIKLIIG